MSTALAIASVSAVLKDLLNNGMIDHDIVSTVGNVRVSCIPPDRIDTTVNNQVSQLNLFMYQATQNPGWRNIGMPSRDSNGGRVANPPLALDLHYLLSAYGTGEFHSEILLGYGMQLFHETPTLSREAIRRALAPPTPVTGGGLPPELGALFTSGLDQQVEQIKISPLPLSAEELYKLWSAFQSNYRPTAAYQVSVVLIETRGSVRTPLPVRVPRVYVVPFAQPVIDRVRPADGGAVILAGSTLTIEGRNLRADDTRIRFAAAEVEPLEVTDHWIRVDLPAALTAGVQGAQVVHYLAMGSPPQPHRGVQSNVAAFVLRPRIVSTLVTGAVTESNGLRSADVRVEIEPGAGDTQNVVLLLNELNPPASRPALAYSFKADIGMLSPPGLAAILTIPMANVVAGAYLLRISIDGAQSPLGSDAEGRFTSPQVTV